MGQFTEALKTLNNVKDILGVYQVGNLCTYASSTQVIQCRSFLNDNNTNCVPSHTIQILCKIKIWQKHKQIRFGQTQVSLFK